MDEDKNRDIFGFRLSPRDTEHHDEEDHSRLTDGMREDPFDSFMFRRPREAKPQIDKKDDSNSLLGHVDIDEVMNHVDTLITSARELKPLFGKVRPFLEQFIEKNKS